MCEKFLCVNKILCHVCKTFKENINSINIYNNTIKSVCLYVSGVSEHITNIKELLKNFKYENIKLNCSNGCTCDFEEYGEFEFEDNKTKIKLNWIYYSKGVIKNMISGVELAKSNIKSNY